MDPLEQTDAMAGRVVVPPDARIAELADTQHGVVARRQLLALGIGPEAIKVRLRAGRLHRIHAGVYSVGHRVLSREARWMAAVLFCGRGAVLSHRSAAALWGIRRPTSGPVEVTTGSKSRSRGSIRRHYSALPADEVTKHDGIRVTTVPRTIFDLAADAGADAAESALRQAEYLRLHDRLSLPHLLDRYPGRRGSRAVRDCLARRRETGGRARSWLEEVFLPFLDRHGLPRPARLNASIEVQGRRFEVDCHWPRLRAVVELDGFAAHGTRAAFRADRFRDRKLRVGDYRFMRLAPEQLEDEPAEVAADLRVLLRARG